MTVRVHPEVRTPRDLGARPRDPIAEALALRRTEARLLGASDEPMRLGRYVLLGPIGSGGLGVVYEAYDPELHRRLAIKVLHAAGEASDGGGLVREARALAQLAHPNVVAVHDTGELDDGRVFVAMERIVGETLEAWTRGGHPWPEIRDAVVQAARGLAAAHRAGLIHGDVKPSNLMVGSDGRVRVVDFGLARASASLHPAALVGSPAYMAPEQIAGGPHGPAVDQFALCVVLYEALAGHRPFIGADVPAILAAIERCDPPAPSPAIPAWLHRVIARGLARDPSARWPDMDALADALLADRRTRRRRALGFAATIVVVAIAAAALTWTLRPGPTAEQLARIEQLEAEARAAAAAHCFVYPQADGGATAYGLITALEAEQGPAGELAAARAHALREELAAVLVALGDRYRDREGGAGFASDFYAQALVFAPERSDARGATTLSPGEIHELADRAARGEFTPAELVIGAELAALAEDDPEARRARTETLLARGDGPAPSSAARLRRLVDAGAAAPVPVDPRPSVSPAPVAAPAPSPVAPAPAEDPDVLVAAATRAVADGDEARARALLQRALGRDRGHVGALSAMARLAFDDAAYHDAIRFATRAVAAAPRRADLRLLLGDAQFRVLDYPAARAQYERAVALGSASARKRLALLHARTGEPTPR